MKPTTIAIGCLLAGAGPQLMAASLLMDDFTGPAMQLGSNPPLPTGLQSANDTPVLASRWIFSIGNPVWLVTQDPAAGTLTYSLNMLRGQPGASDYLSMIYSYGQSLASIVGLNSVRLTVDSVVGSAMVGAVVAVGPIMEQQFVALDAAGNVDVPLVKPSLPDASARIVIRIYPTTPNFSITLSSLWLVPEPGSALLAATAAIWLTSRRRRSPGGS
jgi:hypothetical protein